MTAPGEVPADRFAGAPSEPACRRLFEARAHEPSVSWAWWSALAISHVRDGDRVRWVVVDGDGGPDAVVPVVARSERFLGLRRTRAFPMSELYDTHTDVLARRIDPGGVREILRGLDRAVGPWDVFHVDRVVEGSELHAALLAALVAEGIPHVAMPAAPSYRHRLPDSFDAYLASRSARFRSYLRRMHKRLAAAGAVEVRRVVGPTGLDEAYDDLLRVERGSWKHAHGTAITRVPRQESFYGNLVRFAGRDGLLRLYLLYAGGEPIAYDLGTVAHGRFSYLKTSFVEDRRDAGPATVLRAAVLEDLIADGVGEFDLPAEPYEWESRWADDLRWHVRVVAWRRTVAGAVSGAHAALKARRARAERARGVEHRDPRALRPS